MIAAAALGATAGLGVWAGWIEPRSLRVRRHAVAVPGLTAPLRAVAIGDLQPWVHHWPARRLRAAFARAAAEKPDIVFWLGDYYNAPTKGLARALAAAPAARRLYDRLQTPMDAIAAEMGRLTAPMGAYAVLGNHDWAWDGLACADALRAHGITPLIGRAVEAVHPVSGARLRVAGLDDASSRRRPGWRFLRAGRPQVLLTHAPDVWGWLPDPPPLTLAGHTHAGQVRLPFLRERLPWLGRRHRYGWRRRGDAALLVTGGLGTSGPPLRFRAPPEALVLDLTPSTDAPDGP